jgi:hypothetical protein
VFFDGRTPQSLRPYEERRKFLVPRTRNPQELLLRHAAPMSRAVKWGNALPRVPDFRPNALHGEVRFRRTFTNATAAARSGGASPGTRCRSKSRTLTTLRWPPAPADGVRQQGVAQLTSVPLSPCCFEQLRAVSHPVQIVLCHKAAPRRWIRGGRGRAAAPVENRPTPHSPKDLQPDRHLASLVMCSDRRAPSRAWRNTGALAGVELAMINHNSQLNNLKGNISVNNNTRYGNAKRRAGRGSAFHGCLGTLGRGVGSPGDTDLRRPQPQTHCPRPPSRCWPRAWVFRLRLPLAQASI